MQITEQMVFTIAPQANRQIVAGLVPAFNQILPQYGINTLLRLDHFFGQARQSNSSHRVYKTPWIGDPRVNIQNENGKAKAYQVRQVCKAIERMEFEDGTKK